MRKAVSTFKPYADCAEPSDIRFFGKCFFFAEGKCALLYDKSKVSPKLLLSNFNLPLIPI